MRKILFSGVVLLMVTLLFSHLSAQNRGMSYQAVARDAAGALIANQTVNVSFLVRETTINGTIVYEESHSPVTNGFALFSVVIGEGNVKIGDFSTINWGNGDHFLEVEINGASVGVTKLNAVPYSKIATDMSIGLLKDVDVSSGLAVGKILKYNGTGWVPQDDAVNPPVWLKNGNNIYYNSGRIGIGTSSPSYPLHLTKDTMSINGLEIANLGSANLGLDGDLVPYGGSALAYDIGNNTSTEHWDDVVASEFITFSDERLKNSISELKVGLREILALRPVQYRYNRNIDVDNRLRFGLLAQEVETVIPNVVINEDVDVDPETGDIIRKQAEYKAMNYVDLVPVLIQAIQDQQEYIRTLEKRIEKLENEK
ncbi:MAG: tail fiber domain-containing protein [Bacteroidia bacterium]